MGLLFRLALLATVFCCLAFTQTAAQPAPAPAPQPQPGAPAQDAAALTATANASLMKGDYEGAKQPLRAAWDLLQQSPPENPARYQALKRLTSVYAATGDFKQADDYLQMAINWRETVLGPQDPKIVDDLQQAVGLCRAMKDYDRGFAILDRILSTQIRINPESAAVADVFTRQAQLYMDKENPRSASNALRTALQIRLKIGGPFDVSLVPDLDRRAAILTVLREYAEAEATYRHALAIREMLYGKEDPDLISTLDGLAYACFGQKKYDVAEPIYQRLLDLWEKHVGKEHPMLAIALDKSAVFFADQKKYDRSGELRVRANAIRAHFLAIGLAQQGTELIEQSKYDEAYVLYDRAVKALDPPNPLYDTARGQAEGVLAIVKPQLKNPGLLVKDSGKDCAAPGKPAAPAKKTPAASKTASVDKK